jgi:4-carboxymuconolactone decarboxylase
MAKEKGKKKAKEFLEAMRKERGYLPPSYPYVAEKDIDFLEAYDNLYKRSLSDGKECSAKVREFVAIGILAYRGNDAACYNHVKRALELGATKQELLEAIEATIVPGGTPTFGAGLRALMKVEEEEKKGGK